jgi:hypothetical protein
VLERDDERIGLLPRERCAVILDELVLTLEELGFGLSRGPVVEPSPQPLRLFKGELLDLLATLLDDRSFLLAKVLKAVGFELESIVVLEVARRHAVALFVIDRFELDEEGAGLVCRRRDERVVLDKVVVVANHLERRIVTLVRLAREGELLASEAVFDCGQFEPSAMRRRTVWR